MIQKKWFIFVLALMSIFAFNVSGAFAQGDDTFCYEFNFAASPYTGVFEVEKGQYEEDLETEQGSYVTTLQPNGTYELSLRYYPTGGFGFYSRVYKISLNVSVPGDSSFRQAVVYSRAFGAEVAWNMYPDGDFAFAPTTQSISSYLDYNGPQNTNPTFSGTLYGETSAPAGWENWVWITLRNTVPGSRIVSAKFEGLYTSPFGSSNCDWIPSPQPTNTPTNPPPPSPSPTLTLTPTATNTPTATATSLASYTFTFPANAATCHTDPATGVSFFPIITVGQDDGTSMTSVNQHLNYTVDVSERVFFTQITNTTFSENSNATDRVWWFRLKDGETTTVYREFDWPSVWTGSPGSPGSSGNSVGNPHQNWGDFWQYDFIVDDDDNGYLTIPQITVTYQWNSAWEPGDSPCPESYTPTPIPSATHTPTSTALPSLTPTPTRTPTQSTDQQCGFLNSSFSSGISNWTTTGDWLTGAVVLANADTLSQTLTLPAANVRLTVVTSAIDDDSGSGTAQLAYTSSLGSHSGNMSYTLANFQSVNNQRVYQWYFTTSAGSTTIQFTATLTGSITGLNILSACLESVSSIPTQTPDPNLPDTGSGGSGGTGGGSDDSGSSGLGFQCGQTITPPGFSFLNIPASIGNWILYLARVLLQWLICTLLPIINGIVDLIGFIWNFFSSFGWFVLQYILVYTAWLFQNLLGWIWGHIANFFNLLLLVFKAIFAAGQILFGNFILDAIVLILQIFLIVGKLINIFKLLIQRMFLWIFVATGSVAIIVNAWNSTGPSAIGINIHDCVNRPLESDICAFYYIAEYTFLSGTIGSLIVPFITAILYTTAMLYLIDLVAKFLKDFRSGTK